ncbi:chemotaxis protein CheB [Boseongicola aestuarii]|uniref:Sensor protein FixL n=1 Tax=Boseongicola aestuarii TaxID=1470561 RepID=A0A238J6P3_9RHOB|nr:chemotaxis protein CheB [Boseongicola aestuarii]SMX25805.1 Blue-light-activated protein [Boseongicola aestuarii]
MARQPKTPSTKASGKTPPKGAPKSKTSRSQPVPKGIPVVGLGASAGGLQAFTQFFQAMPNRTGMAFVVIHHVDPDHESLMADLLAKHTRMTVALAEDDTPIAADHVYIIPPNRFLSIEKGVLHLSEPAERRGMRLPIDFFLRSLAEDQKQKAVAIIMSGTGGDGTAGIRSIKETGGMVLVQDPTEAAHDGMPRSAIATGSVDHILPVVKMPAVIQDYTAHPFIARGATTKVLGENARGALSDIIKVLKAHTPINFEYYKEGTLLRRIERRMALRHLENAADYLALLKDQPDEAENLCADLLICVTSFFRDPDAFAYLADQVIRDLVVNCASGQPIRIWVPACATGEEAYSLAMLVIEKIEALRKDVKLQVFASDVDEYALSVARAGVYPDAIAGDISPERLKRFFDKEDHTYRVKPELRDAVVFARQNILADAPFSKLDLISCRNLLIYLNTDAQERIIQMFHFALNDGGLLLLGSSETANNHENYFQPVSKKHRLYRRVGKARHRLFDFPISQTPILGLSTPAVRTAEVSHGLRLAELSQKFLVDRYAPAAVLLNARMETLFVQGPADQYLKVPTGEASQDLLAMAREGLRAKLGSTIRTAFQTEQDVTASGNVTRAGRSVPVTISAHPMVVDEVKLVLVTFVDMPVKQTTPTADNGLKDSAVQTQLEQELDATRLDLQNTIREYERSTEELKASNEEAMSMNEEFQSTNEELETSKEELQSLNEELTTLNTQLQQKVEDERRLTDDLNNLLSSSGIATVFLDRDLNIMRFTPTTRNLFNVIANDMGRPFSDITGKIDDPALLADAEQVLEHLTPIEADVRADDGKWFIRRILPYRTRDKKIDGVVITFLDVTELKALQQASQKAQNFAEAIVGTVREPMLVLDDHLNITKASRSFCRTFQTRPEDIEGRALFALQDGQWDQPGLRELLERVLPDKITVEAHEIAVNVADRGKRTVLVNARQLRDDANSSDLILMALEDVTERLESQARLEEREARLSAIFDAAPEAIITIDENGVIGSYSPAARTILGYTEKEVIGQNVKILMPEQERDRHDGYMSHYMETGEKKIIGIGREMNARHKDGSDVPIRLTVAEWWINGQRNFTGILHDLSEDMKRRDALQRAQKMEAVGQLTGGLAHDFNNLLTVIIGNLELIEIRVEDFPVPELLNEALEAANLGAKLTKQLLAFSRKQPLLPTKVALNDLVTEVKPLLVRTLGDDISVKTDLADDLRLTLTDPGQVENAILNLAINARDAMPEGGRLTIETKNVVLDADYAATQVDIAPGDYVALSVTDTGVGMAADVIARAFEPFFTTKAVGAGSGLGLSMVYGFAKQSGGHVAIYSEEGIGTTLTLYLPPFTSDEQEVAAPTEGVISPSRNETILVVEDDPLVRRLTVERLENLGYRTMAAENGPAALEILRDKNEIDLVLSDVVMPGGMTGFEVADQALKIKPTLKVLLATGYASSEDISSGADRRQHHVLRKPYTLRDLAKALRDELE